MIDEKLKSALYDLDKELMDKIFARHSELLSEIEYLRTKVDGLIQDQGAPLLTGHPIDPNNFCLEINNRHKYFSDFMDWIKKEDSIFADKIVFRSVCYITRQDGLFSVRFTSKVQMINFDDWADWCVKEKIK